MIHFLSLILFSMSASAELYQAGLQTRCLAMGGTCVSHVRGASSVFYNPAALAGMEGLELTIAQLQAGVSKNVVDMKDQFQGTDFTASDLDKLYGKNFMVDVSGRAGIAVPNFGFGVYSNNFTNMKFSDPTFPTFKMNFISDYGYAISGALPLWTNASLGLTVRHVKRWGGDQEINVTSLIGSNSNSIADSNFENRGVGRAADLGFLTTFDHPLKPTFSLVWQDVGVTTFSQSSGTAPPPAQYDNLIFGTSIQHELLFIDFTSAFEYKFIRTNSGDGLDKKLHLGTEISLGLIDLRAGLNQGYVTYGAGVDLWFLQVDAAAYTSELGTYAGQAPSDNYSISLTLNLDFDQSFKLRDDSGKKRRLKQRR